MLRGSIRAYLVFASCAFVVSTVLILTLCTCTPTSTRLNARAVGGNSVRDQSPTSVQYTEHVYLAMLIMSSPADAATRAVIRDTWLQLAPRAAHSTTRHFFPIGIANLSQSALALLNDEQDLHNDLILLASHHESYRNLARKTLLSFDALYRSSLDFQFALKVDSDSFVRVGALVKALKDIARPRLYWGFLDGRAKPFRKGKWREKEWILCDRYLPYQLGGGYVLGRDLVSYLSRNADLLKMYRNEDASVGAWLAGLDVHYVHDPRFDTEFRSRGCSNDYLITHKQAPADLESLYRTLRETGVLCKREFRTRASYVYDWAQPPSLCCTRANDSRIP